MKKYKLTEEFSCYGRTFYRIRALRDFGCVKTGDAGGFVESEDNLSHENLCWVSGDAWVSGNAQVFGDAWVSGNAQVYSNARVFGDAWVKPPLQIQGTRHFFTISSYTEITIGCESHSVEEWESNYEKIGRGNGYSKEEIAEYYEYIQLAKRYLARISPEKC